MRTRQLLLSSICMGRLGRGNCPSQGPCTVELPSPPGHLPGRLGVGLEPSAEHTGVGTRLVWKGPCWQGLVPRAQAWGRFPVVINFPFQLLPASLCICMKMGCQLGLEGPKVFVFQRAPSAPSKSLLSEVVGWAGIQRPLSGGLTGRQGVRGLHHRGAALGSWPFSALPSNIPARPLSGWLQGPTSPVQAILTSPLHTPERASAVWGSAL